MILLGKYPELVFTLLGFNNASVFLFLFFFN